VKEVYTLADLRDWSAATRDINPPIRLGVFGDPVAHSLSPQMQNAALKATGLEMQYARFQISSEELETALRLLPDFGFVGINLTVPHKVSALGFVDEIDASAEKIGAINTVRIADKKLVAYNTDSRGFARAIRQEFSVDLRDLRVLLLGAGGGAGRAIAMQCAFENCERLVLVNRSLGKAQQLADELRPYFKEARVLGPVPRLEAVEWKDAALRFEIANVDLVVNATPIGMKRSDPPVLPASLLAPHLMIYDTIYAPARTALLQAAAEAGARGANGLTMLLHQGALSFETWFDREAPLEAMRGAIL
jgi:shikimate dehydrogenase